MDCAWHSCACDSVKAIVRGEVIPILGTIIYPGKCCQEEISQGNKLPSKQQIQVQVGLGNGHSNYYESSNSDDMIYFCNLTPTWVELHTVKSQANTVVLRSMVRIPNTQVSPSRGRRMTVAFSVALLRGRCWTVGRSNTSMVFVCLKWWYLSLSE